MPAGGVVILEFGRGVKIRLQAKRLVLAGGIGFCVPESRTGAVIHAPNLILIAAIFRNRIPGLKLTAAQIEYPVGTHAYSVINEVALLMPIHQIVRKAAQIARCIGQPGVVAFGHQGAVIAVNGRAQRGAAECHVTPAHIEMAGQLLQGIKGGRRHPGHHIFDNQANQSHLAAHFLRLQRIFKDILDPVGGTVRLHKPPACALGPDRHLVLVQRRREGDVLPWPVLVAHQLAGVVDATVWHVAIVKQECGLGNHHRGLR